MEETKDYSIVIYCALARITTSKSLTDEQLDDFIEDVLKNGYADVAPGKTTIYPAHTITKVEASFA